MDHYDFESTITDADFDFTLDDILNEFHSGGPSSAMDKTQQDAVSDIHAVISQQNNNPIYGSGIEGASTINTNEFEDSVMNGSDLTTPDVSGAPETEAYEGSNPYDYQSVYSFVSRDDPDLDQIISELNGSAPASDESDYEEPADEESYPAEDYASEEDETEPAPQEEYEEERRFMSFQEGWENLKDSIRISAGGVPTGFKHPSKRMKTRNMRNLRKLPVITMLLCSKDRRTIWMTRKKNWNPPWHIRSSKNRWILLLRLK